MDTISRENNSMLPIGGIIVGVLALGLALYAAVAVSKVKSQATTTDEKVTAVESKVDGATSTAAAAKQDVSNVRKETSEAFGNVANYINELRTSVGKLEEAQKKPAPHDPTGHKGPATSTEPPVAGPDEYIVKPG